MAKTSRLPRLKAFALLTALVAGSAVATESVAHAQDAQAQLQGRTLFNEGVALFNKADYENACPKFEASLKAFPGIGTRGKLAECYEKLGRYASAWAAYREVAQLATRSGEPAREQVASARAKALEPKLSYLTITLPSANDVPGLVIKRGGNELDRSKLGSAEPVDAGSISIEVSAPGRRSFTTQLTATQGQSTKLEIPALAPLHPDPVIPPPPPPPPPSPTYETPGLHGDPPNWQKPVGLVMLGVGVIGVGVGAILGLSAKSKYNDAFNGGDCDHATNQCDATGQTAVSDARSTATLSTVFFLAGGGVAATGLVVFLTAPSSHRSALTLTPITVAGGGGLVLRGGL